MRNLIFFCWMLAVPLRAQSLCDRIHSEEGLSAREAVTPIAVLGKLVAKAGWKEADFRLIPIPGPGPVQRNATSVVCETPRCNCIFYDPTFIVTSPPVKADEWNAVFILAHEAAHHIRQHLLPGSTQYSLPRFDKEAEADHWAGWALEKLHAPVDAVLAAADYISSSEVDTVNYYGRCHRRMDALSGYNEGAAEDGAPIAVPCLQCYAAKSAGLYLRQDLPAGPLTANAVARCGTGPVPDQPSDFTTHLRGGCLISPAKAGTLLTWSNTGLCR